MDLGVPELLIILVIVLLIFGSNRLPKLARSLGQASREFRTGMTEGVHDEGVDAAPVTTVAAERPGNTPGASGEPARN